VVRTIATYAATSTMTAPTMIQMLAEPRSARLIIALSRVQARRWPVQ
jgi:TRAP-type uncharacterized transport system fused permease subunit